MTRYGGFFNRGALLAGAIAAISCALVSCGSLHREPLEQGGRVFATSFESADDFNGFYIVPQDEYATRHELSGELKTDGQFSHKAWITGARSDTNDGLVYLPHRAYPTVQLHKTAGGGFVTPCLISFKAYLSMDLRDKPAGSIDDWFSFATLSPDKSDSWKRTVVVNVTPDKLLRLVHVPNQGEQEYLYQNETLAYPREEWVEISIYADFSRSGGYAKVWQNGTLVSHARIEGGSGILEQVHFGLYAAASIDSGTVYNDDLIIREVRDEEEALDYLRQYRFGQ